LCTSTLVSPRFSVVISPLSASYRLRKRSTLASARARHAFAFRPARFFFIVTLCTRASLSAFTTPTDALATITAAVTNAVTDRFARARGRRAGSRDMSTRVVAVFDRSIE